MRTARGAAFCLCASSLPWTSLTQGVCQRVSLMSAVSVVSVPHPCRTDERCGSRERRGEGQRNLLVLRCLKVWHRHLVVRRLESLQLQGGRGEGPLSCTLRAMHSHAGGRAHTLLSSRSSRASIACTSLRRASPLFLRACASTLLAAPPPGDKTGCHPGRPLTG